MSQTSLIVSGDGEVQPLSTEAMSVEPIRVLCVDDNLAVAAMLALSIQQEEGLQHVGTLHRADDLLEAVSRYRPDVVLLDLSMPGREPLEVLAEVVAVSPATRVIVFSGFDDRDTVDRAIAAGAWGYVPKDSSTEGILMAIRRVSEGQFVLPEVS